jgi:hypothetical protein
MNTYRGHVNARARREQMATTAPATSKPVAQAPDGSPNSFWHNLLSFMALPPEQPKALAGCWPCRAGARQAGETPALLHVGEILKGSVMRLPYSIESGGRMALVLAHGVDCVTARDGQPRALGVVVTAARPELKEWLSKLRSLPVAKFWTRSSTSKTGGTLG